VQQNDRNGTTATYIVVSLLQCEMEWLG